MNKNSEINLKEHKIFFVGGKVQKVKDNNILKGKMYVESFIPAKSNNKKIILIPQSIKFFFKKIHKIINS